MNEPIKTYFCSREQLDARQRAEMFGLLSRHFDGVTPAQFQKDLAEKNWVIRLERESRLVGFSTLLVYETSFEGEVISVVYSGDTIVAPEAWNSPALARAWIGCVRDLRERYPRGLYYWLLLTSGFRTYRFLPVFWREFFPRFDAPTPPGQKRLAEFLARQRFGDQYDASSGTVRFLRPQRLKESLNAVPENKTVDPHVAFFLRQNPGHAAGDELVCLTELADDNLTAAGRRMVSASMHELHGYHC